MTITINITPEVQAELARQAAAHDLAIEVFIHPSGPAARPDKSCTLDHRQSSGRKTKPAFTGFE